MTHRNFMISRQDVQHIAKLARLGLTSGEIEKFQRELSSILDYIEKLKEIDVSGVKPTSHPRSVENAMRKDEVKKTESQQINKLVEAAPEKKKGYIKVKSIL